MIQAINKKLVRWAASVNNRTLFLLFFIVGIFIRLPFFFRDYVDRDESTFILMAQSVVDGNLPFVELWDLKPPMIYYTLALIIFLFGKSFIAIRLAGTLMVAVMGYYSYLIGKKVHSKSLGIWAGIITVYLSSLFGSVQGVMSEHMSMAFFLPALYLVMTKKQLPALFLSGILMGAALMTKLNLAYSVLMVTGFVFALPLYERAFITGIKRATSIAFGILVVLGLNLIPYALEGKPEVFINSVFLAPLAYANIEDIPFIKIAPFILFLILFFGLTLWRSQLSLKNRDHAFLILAILGISFSFIRIGKINGHYLLQFYPVFIILLGIAVYPLLTKAGRYLPTAGLILMLLLPVEAYKEYVFILKNKQQYGTYFNGEGIRIPHYLEGKNIETGDILFFEYHIGYWLTGVNPPTKIATHPSNLCRNTLFPYVENPRLNSIEELKFIIDSIRPTLIVVRKNAPVFHKSNAAANRYVDMVLDNFYEHDKDVGESSIYTRSKLP